MELGAAAFFSGLQGLTTVLPLSASGHRIVARIWLSDGSAAAAAALSSAAELGCLLALLLAVRRRLSVAVAEGIRGVARPAVLHSSDGGRDAVAIVIAALSAGILSLLLKPVAQPLEHVPLVVGTTLLVTGGAVASTHLAPSPKRVCPGAAGALLVGLAYGLAIVPGASQVGAAFVVLRWLGVGSWRAAELALLIAAPVMTLELLPLAFQLRSPGVMMLSWTNAAGVVTAFVTASVGLSFWRWLCEHRRTPLLGLWLLPLALALLAYGYALPSSWAA